MEDENDIHRIIMDLIYKRSFFARLFSGICKVQDESIKTACVMIDPRTRLGISLRYNPKFIMELRKNYPDKDLFYTILDFILEHEGYHLVGQHVQRFIDSDYSDYFGQDAFNIAADLATNSLIEQHYALEQVAIRPEGPPTEEGIYPEVVYVDILPRIGIFPDKADKSGHNFNYPPLLSMEAYLEKLKNDNNIKKIPVPDIRALLSGKYTGEHKWSDKPLTPKDKLIADQKLNNNLKKYIKDTVKNHQKDQGDMPGYLESMLKDYLEPEHSVPWAELIRHHVATGMNSVRKRSMMRLSRRKVAIPDYMPYPGRRVENSYKIVEIWDTSGSMSDMDLELGARVTLSLKQYNPGLTLYIIQADTDVHSVTEIKEESDIPKKLLGRGGTDFCKPIQYAEENLKPDIIIYYTDGYGTAPDMKPEATMVWVLSPNGQAPAQYGKVVRVGP